MILLEKERFFFIFIFSTLIRHFFSLFLMDLAKIINKLKEKKTHNPKNQGFSHKRDPPFPSEAGF